MAIGFFQEASVVGVGRLTWTSPGTRTGGRGSPWLCSMDTDRTGSLNCSCGGKKREE